MSRKTSGRAQSIAGDPTSALRQALQQFRTGFMGVGFFSALINLLALTGSLFMLQVYDRVLPSKSVPTLIGLALIVFGLYAFQAVLELVRTRVLVRIGTAFDEAMTERVYHSVLKMPLMAPRGPEGIQPIRDLDVIRSFLTGPGPGALFDIPWIPIYLGLCFAFHIYIGITATVGAIFIIALTLLTEALSRGPIRDASRFGASRNAFAELSRRNTEVFHALGMTGRMAARWRAANAQFSGAQERLSDVTGGLGSIVRVLRVVLQSTVLAVGAYLVIDQQATAGIIIASAILSGRALAPADIAIANWRGFGAARQAWHRLTGWLRCLSPDADRLQLPAPSSSLSVSNCTVTAPSSKQIVVQGVSFTLNAGEALGIVGPSGSGKSSLVRALVGVWPTLHGKIRLDGAELDRWPTDVLGRHLGYLPQEVSLCDGTVTENISRFDSDPSSEGVIAAAKAAGLHEFILSLPDGYETAIGESGEVLSAGQRQRIGLARALYGDPFLVVLDEPNSNLDLDGERALTGAIRGVCERGGIAIVIAHRPSALVAVDFVLALFDGQPRAFGRRDEVLTPVPILTSTTPRRDEIEQRNAAS